jgi:hypothetical protein
MQCNAGSRLAFVERHQLETFEVKKESPDHRSHSEIFHKQTVEERSNPGGERSGIDEKADQDVCIS